MLHLIGLIVFVSVVVLIVGYVGSFASDFLDYAKDSLAEGVTEMKRDIAPIVELFKKEK